MKDTPQWRSKRNSYSLAMSKNNWKITKGDQTENLPFFIKLFFAWNEDSSLFFLSKNLTFLLWCGFFYQLEPSCLKVELTTGLIQVSFFLQIPPLSSLLESFNYLLKILKYWSHYFIERNGLFRNLKAVISY